jgi:lipase chaperone LimK
MKLRHFFPTLAVLAVCISVTQAWLRSSDTPPTDVQHSHPTALHDGLPAEPVQVSDTVLDVAALRFQLATTSKRDVDIPTSLTLDAQGNLVADEGLRILMDFFLALDGEQDAAQIRALFLAAVAAQCSADCVSDAAALFDQYQDYLATLTNQLPDGAGSADLRERLETVVALRHQTLGPELASALFGYEEQYDHYRVRQWAIQQDASLSAMEKQAQLQALQFSAPAGLIEREQSTQQLRQARQLQSDFAASDATALHAARTELLGSNAAERLQQLDHQRQAWDQRYHRYREEMAALDSSGLAMQDRLEQITLLRQRHFDAQENQRVAALDRIHAAETP